jgi:4-hydroxythreonine-4-phosphate dehydrogenase
MSTSLSPAPVRVGITLGDINGIGPELAVRVFEDNYFKQSSSIVLYGPVRALNTYRKILNAQRFNFTVIPHPSQAQPGRLNIVDCVVEGVERLDMGKASEAGGLAAWNALTRAVEDAKAGELDALVTLPVDKASIALHQPDFRGHTEMLADAFGVKDSLMFMVSDTLRVALVTGHIPLREVSGALNAKHIVHKLTLLHRCLHDDFNLPRGQIAVLGLNPHAGDAGLLGNEEQDIIRPAIEEAQQRGILCEGPYPADGFFGAMKYRNFDAVLAMYHDQGLAPFKLLSGHEGVNFTAGLPIVRTSPAHGVAYDLAGSGQADPGSFRQAIYVAIDTARRRKGNLAARENALDGVKNNLLGGA